MSRIILFFTALFFSISCSFSQIQIPDTNTRHIVFTHAGFDYNLIAVSLGYLNYCPKFKTGVYFDISQGTALLFTSNLKSQIGLQTWQGSFGKFNCKTNMGFIFTRSYNKAGLYNSIGFNFQNNFGLSINRINLGIDIQYNPYILTLIKHSDFYRKYYFENVKDGWYRNLSNNIRIGSYISVLTDKRRLIELSLRLGYQTSGKLDLLIPSIYGIISINKKFN